MVILIAIATFFSTLLGGIFALKLKDKLHLVLGFSAGAVIAVAFFDLIPESLGLAGKYYEISTVLTITAIGFLSYLVLDRLIFFHVHDHSGHDGTDIHGSHGDGGDDRAPKHVKRGILGAGSLCVHSFFDGMAIGLAFQVSSAVGVIVAIAVLSHDFSDGINTVGMILKNNGDRKNAFRWLVADAMAPVLGAGSTLLFSVPEQGLGIILSLFSGFFLYIGASDLIPESHHSHPKILTTIMTLAGAGVLYLAIRFAGV